MSKKQRNRRTRPRNVIPRQIVPPPVEPPSSVPGQVMPTVIARAIVDIQKNLKPLVKSSVNGEYESTYVPLDEVMDKAIELLSKHHIAVMQPPVTDDHEHIALETILLHDSGLAFSRTTRLALGRADPQGHGSAITYTRRYALMGMLGLTAKDEDDDGNVASGKSLKPTKEQMDEIVSLMQQLKYSRDLIEKEVQRTKTRDHAKLTLMNYRKRCEERVKALELDEKAQAALDRTPDIDESSPQATLMARIKKLGLASPGYENKVINRATKKPFISKVKTDDELRALDEFITMLEEGVHTLPAEFYAPKSEPIVVNEDVA